MDRSRLIFALALSLVVLMGWPLIMHYLAPPPPIEIPQETEQPPSQPATADKQPQPQVSPNKQTPTPPQRQVTTTQVAQRDLTIRTAFWRATLTNRGAVATSWILEKYKKNGEERKITAADGGELELIPKQIPEGLAPLLSLRTPASPEIATQLNQVTFQIDGVRSDENEVWIDPGASRKISFTFSSPSVTATKSFVFNGEGFVFDVTASVRTSSGEQPAEIVLGPRIGDQSDTQTSSYSIPPQVVAYTREGNLVQVPGAAITPSFATITAIDPGSNQIEIDKPLAGDVDQIKIVADSGATLIGFARVVNREANSQRLTVDSLPPGASKGHGVAQGTDKLRNLFRWAGVTDHYFAMLAVPEQVITEVTLMNVRVKGAGPDDPILEYPVAALPVSDSVTTHVFVGPKDLDVLAMTGRELGANLDAVIDWGLFSFAVRPLIPLFAWSLNGLMKLTNNFGWAIVIVTVLINLALSPLRFYSSKKMKQAARHQPRMKELQEKMKKLKENPKKHERELQQLQQEQLALMKEANPLGGCMPLLLQMPIFWAVYLYLGSSLDVRRAPWILWIDDLSRPDPYKILPIIMCVTMIASTKLMPQPPSADPSMKMQRIMMTWLMPIMLTWLFFFSAPSGLVLYWMVSNIVGVLIQLWINRRTAYLTAGTALTAPASGEKSGPRGPKGAKEKGKKRQQRRGGAEAEGF